jgi:hypothetical protein
MSAEKYRALEAGLAESRRRANDLEERVRDLERRLARQAGAAAASAAVSAAAPALGRAHSGGAPGGVLPAASLRHLAAAASFRGRDASASSTDISWDAPGAASGPMAGGAGGGSGPPFGVRPVGADARSFLASLRRDGPASVGRGPLALERTLLALDGRA